MYKHQTGRGWYNGRLDADQEQRVQRHEPFLINDLHTDQILEAKVAENLFNVYDRNAINYVPSRPQKNRKLLEILRGKAPEGFHEFLQALSDTGHDEAYRRLTLPQEMDVITEEAAVQTDIIAETGSQASASGETVHPAPQPVFSVASLAEEQKGQQQKLTHIESRVDRLADSVEGLASKVEESNRRKLEAERAHGLKLEELQQALSRKEAMLFTATEEISFLRNKIDQLEKEKSREQEKANSTIKQLTKEVEELSMQKARLERDVQRLRTENEELREDVHKLRQDKEHVHKELERQSLRVQAVSDQNDRLEKELGERDRTMQVIVNSVKRMEMRVEASDSKKKNKSSVKKRGRKVSSSSSESEERDRMTKSAAVSKPHQKAKGEPVLEPVKQYLARPNSRKL